MQYFHCIIGASFHRFFPLYLMGEATFRHKRPVHDRGIFDVRFSYEGVHRQKNAHASNIANTLTDGYRKIRVTMADEQDAGASARADKVVDDGSAAATTAADISVATPSNVDLVEEMTGDMTALRTFEANAKVTQTTDEMLGTIIDVSH